MKNKICKYCGKNFTSTRRHKNYCSDDCFEQNRIQYKKQYDRKYNKDNKIEIQERRKEYHIYYRLTHKKYIRDYFRERRKIDLNFRLLHVLRCRLNRVIRGKVKIDSTKNLLGCSLQKLKQHLEKRFKKGMTWNNYGRYGWHIDHIIPCCNFNLNKPSEQKKCFHYTNLQPLWAEENLRKHKHLIKEV